MLFTTHQKESNAMKSTLIMVALVAITLTSSSAFAAECKADDVNVAPHLQAFVAAQCAPEKLPETLAKVSQFCETDPAKLLLNGFLAKCEMPAPAAVTATPVAVAPAASVAKNPLSVFNPHALAWTVKSKFAVNVLALINGIVARKDAPIAGIQKAIKCAKAKRGSDLAQACSATNLAKGAADFALEGDAEEEIIGLKGLSALADKDLTFLQERQEHFMSQVPATRDATVIGTAKEKLKRIEEELAALQRTDPQPTEQISKKQAERLAALQELEKALRAYPWDCQGRDIAFRDELTRRLQSVPNEKKVYAQPLLALANDPNEWVKLKTCEERMTLLWTAMSMLNEGVLDSLTASPDLGIAGATPVDPSQLAAHKGKLAFTQDSSGVLNAGVVGDGGAVSNDNGAIAVTPDTKVAVVPVSVSVSGGGAIQQAAGGIPLKGNLSYLGTYFDTGVGQAQKSSLNGLKAEMGYEIRIGESGFIIPLLTGGFGYVTGDRPDRAGDVSTDQRFVGILGGGVKGGIGFGRFAPYLVAEGFGLPGPGFSAGVGSTLALSDKVALDASLRWMYLPNTGVPAGLSNTRDLGHVGLNGLSLSAGISF